MSLPSVASFSPPPQARNGNANINWKQHRHPRAGITHASSPSMALSDPATSTSSTLAKGAAAQAQAHAAFAKSTPLAPRTTLRPVQIRQTPVAQTARHVLPALLAGVFAVRFRALVADPVSTMATTTLPLTTALQFAYAVLCLPAPGSSGPTAAGSGSAAGSGAQAGGGGGGGGAAGTAGTKAARKPRPGEGSLKKRGAAESSGSGAITVRTYMRCEI